MKAVVHLPKLDDGPVLELEKSIDNMQKFLPEMKNFILPGGHSNIFPTVIPKQILLSENRKVNHRNFRILKKS